MVADAAGPDPAGAGKGRFRSVWGRPVRASAVSLDGRDVPVAVILPAFNEAATVADCILAFHEALPGASIVVVDNASTDETAARTLRAFDQIDGKGILLHESRRGKGAAVRRGFGDVLADIYVLADADLTYPAAQVHDLMAPIVNGEADMVVGNRLAGGRYASENRRRFHGFGNRLMLAMVNRLFGAHLGDILSGYRVMTGEFVASYPILVEGFELETDMTLHALDKRFRVAEVPIDYRDRPSGSVSKVHTFRDGRRLLATLARLVRHYKPMLFFGGVGLFAALAGLVAALPVFADWIDYRYIYHVPLAILAVGLEITAMLSFGIGLILDSVAHLERLAYERDRIGRRFE
jgi:glycosyltransferase involved in cell wall biosynthesis